LSTARGNLLAQLAFGQQEEPKTKNKSLSDIKIEQEK
jgi:hypothetical protein